MSQASAIQPRLDLSDPLTGVPGIGPRRLAVLEAAGVRTVADLLYRAPLRFQDRSFRATVSTLTIPSPPVRLEGVLRSLRTRQSPVRRIDVTEGVLDDGTGLVPLVWFNQRYLATKFRKGDLVAIFGQPKASDGRLRIENPEITIADPLRLEAEPPITPVYGQIGALPSATVRRLMDQVITMAVPVHDPLPQPLLRRLKLPDLSKALLETHYPSTPDTAKHSADAARRRLAFDEFLAYQLTLRSARRADRDRVRSITVDDRIRGEIRRLLPFRLTSAQKKVLKEIVSDLRSGRPMYRLLQGDVGSGKTIAAVVSALVVALNGYQSAILAPTEILAEQHYRTISALLQGSDLSVEVLSAATPAQERSRILRALRAGTVHLLVGTHAILESQVRFARLALAVVDEQHRFGVDQRRRLFDKGEDVDILLMTATPIPRSLALTLYGDLEISTIDELPPGRNPVRTVVRGSAQFRKVLEFVRERALAGGQAYIVYPLIEETDASSYKDLQKGVEEVKAILGNVPVGVLHGRMKSSEKDEQMRRFARGESSVLVCTTVIEVGVDVAAAEVMLIVDAERYGLAQLHQLRGRVGRGGRPGWCVLMRDERAKEDAKRRLRDFAETSDGFEVAEKDLRTRGAGDLLGTRQAGAPQFRFGNIFEDRDLMLAARLAPSLDLAPAETRD